MLEVNARKKKKTMTLSNMSSQQTLKQSAVLVLKILIFRWSIICICNRLSGFVPMIVVPEKYRRLFWIPGDRVPNSGPLQEQFMFLTT